MQLKDRRRAPVGTLEVGGSRVVDLPEENIALGGGLGVDGLGSVTSDLGQHSEDVRVRNMASRRTVNAESSLETSAILSSAWVAKTLMSPIHALYRATFCSHKASSLPPHPSRAF